MNAVSIPGSEELEVLSPSCIEIVQCTSTVPDTREDFTPLMCTSTVPDTREDFTPLIKRSSSGLSPRSLKISFDMPRKYTRNYRKHKSEESLREKDSKKPKKSSAERMRELRQRRKGNEKKAQLGSVGIKS
ncbi:hypothetical protein AVEN_45037-1 [Araneus ventricosus]|uniref:Uncharacterized protein n=1 Tax=Araneus ventricosus TaxID=182803 RepID=A0A4Y2IQB4_ARAVE|nr:hypothetical protein AVEN_45037-1 [Araneus ventricosus]